MAHLMFSFFTLTLLLPLSPFLAQTALGLCPVLATKDWFDLNVTFLPIVSLYSAGLLISGNTLIALFQRTKLLRSFRWVDGPSLYSALFLLNSISFSFWSSAQSVDLLRNLQSPFAYELGWIVQFATTIIGIFTSGALMYTLSLGGTNPISNLDPRQVFFREGWMNIYKFGAPLLIFVSLFSLSSFMLMERSKFWDDIRTAETHMGYLFSGLMSWMLGHALLSRSLDRRWLGRLNTASKTKETQSPHSSPTELRNCAIMVADLGDFTNQTANLNAEQRLLVLNSYLEAATDLTKFRGLPILASSGDGFLTYIPISHAKGSSEACEELLRLKSQLNHEIQKIASRLSSKGLPSLSLNFGFHYGEVLRGPIVTQSATGPGVFGEAINRCIRTEALCRRIKKEVILSGEFFDQLPQQMKAQFEQQDEIQMRGEETSVRVHFAGPKNYLRAAS